MEDQEERKEKIKVLLTSFHLKVADRLIFTGSRLKIEEIEEVIEVELKNSRFFPCNASISVKGQAVFEGYFIEKISENEYKLHSQRSLATNPFQLADEAQEIFENCRDVTRAYIEKEYRNTIDGIEVSTDV